MTKATSKKLSKAQESTFAKMTTKSGKIRYLISQEWTRREIADKVGVIYQFVRNVELSVVKNPVDKI